MALKMAHKTFMRIPAQSATIDEKPGARFQIEIDTTCSIMVLLTSIIRAIFLGYANGCAYAR